MMRNVAKGDMDLDMVAAVAAAVAAMSMCCDCLCAVTVYVLCLPFSDCHKMMIYHNRKESCTSRSV